MPPTLWRSGSSLSSFSFWVSAGGGIAWGLCCVYPIIAGVDKSDVRFSAMLAQAEVKPVNMAKLGDEGFTSVAFCCCCIGDDEKEVTAFLKGVIGFDPVANADVSVEIAKLLVVWKNAGIQTKAEDKVNAERAAAQLPPQILEGDLESAARAFEKAENDLPGETSGKHKCHSKPYFEKKIGEAETYWKAESLSDVTTCRQAEIHSKSGSQPALGFDAASGSTVTFKLQTKEFGSISSSFRSTAGTDPCAGSLLHLPEVCSRRVWPCSASTRNS